MNATGCFIIFTYLLLLRILSSLLNVRLAVLHYVINFTRFGRTRRIALGVSTKGRARGLDIYGPTVCRRMVGTGASLSNVLSRVCNLIYLFRRVFVRALFCHLPFIILNVTDFTLLDDGSLGLLLILSLLAVGERVRGRLTGTVKRRRNRALVAGSTLLVGVEPSSSCRLNHRTDLEYVDVVGGRAGQLIVVGDYTT